MIALLLLLGLLIYIGLAVLLTFFIRRRFTTSRAKSLATVLSLLVFLLIPTADEFAGKWYFDSLCKKEAGAKVFKSVEGVAGMFGGSLGRSDLKELGYEYREYELGRRYYRTSRDLAGKNIEQEIPQPTSRYVVKEGEWKKIQLNVNKYEEVIIDSQTNEILGRYATFSYGGGWVSAVLRSWGLSGGLSCQLPPNTHKAFYQNTLKPLVRSTLNK